MARNQLKQPMKTITLLNQDVMHDLIDHYRSKASPLLLRLQSGFGVNAQNAPLSHEELKQFVFQKMKQRLLKEKGTYSARERRLIASYLKEIGYDTSPSIVNILASILFKLLDSSLKGLYVSATKLLEVQTILRQNPVIFLPTHRSYADFVLIAYMSFLSELELPCVAAGIDFHNMIILGEILRKCRAFYMKRTFVSNLLYKSVFEEYLKAMFINHFTPIEFFIEGTRSRSLKSLPPKFGLLNTLLETYICGEVSDITIVPIAISYDRVIEEKLFAYEHLGIPKPKESTAVLIRSLLNNSTNFGNFAIGIGSPFNVSSYLRKLPNIHTRNRREEKNKIEKLAQDVQKKQNEISYITLFNAVAVAFSGHILRSLTYTLEIEDLRAKVEIIINILQHCGAKLLLTEIPISTKLLQTCIQEHSSIMEWLETEGKVKFLNTLNHQSISNRDLRNGLKQETLACSIPRIMLQLYVNPTLNLICQPALILTVIHYRKGLKANDLFDQFDLLFSLLKREFVCCDYPNLQDFQRHLAKLSDLKCINVKNDQFFGTEEESSFVLLYMMEPFIVGYYYIADYLLTLAHDVWISSGSLQREIQKRVEQIITKGFFRNTYCLSLDLIGNGVNSFKNLGILKVNTENRWSVTSTGKLQLYHSLLSNFISSAELLQTANLRAKL